ncbi:gluconokinase [Ornithinimicrobium panacihumi]|uniref:gluconokinase n=1 Tax=Ornithinimicrobium panacihumi TaxID=2008449 RepID=UPI003F8CE704
MTDAATPAPGQTPTPPPAAGPLHLVVMGVSGNGKSTIGEQFVQHLGWPFAEGDDFHPQANIDKMSSGQPLDDEDRWPWLRALADWTAEHDARGQSTIMSCSALKRSYRDLLREGGEGVFFVHLVGDPEVILERMAHREHFMKPAMLQSQLDTLEPLEDDEPGMRADIEQTPEQVAAEVLETLGSRLPGTSA